MGGSFYEKSLAENFLDKSFLAKHFLVEIFWVKKIMGKTFLDYLYGGHPPQLHPKPRKRDGSSVMRWLKLKHACALDPLLFQAETRQPTRRTDVQGDGRTRICDERQESRKINYNSQHYTIQTAEAETNALYERLKPNKNSTTIIRTAEADQEFIDVPTGRHRCRTTSSGHSQKLLHEPHCLGFACSRHMCQGKCRAGST